MGDYETKIVDKVIELLSQELQKEDINKSFVQHVKSIIKEINDTNSNLRKLLRGCINSIDPFHFEDYEFYHSIRTGLYAMQLNDSLQLYKDKWRDFFIMGMCHEVWKNRCYYLSDAEENEFSNIMEAKNYYFSKQLIKNATESYSEYINRLKIDDYLIILKISDIKEHLKHDKNIDSKIKERYYNTLSKLFLKIL